MTVDLDAAFGGVLGPGGAVTVDEMETLLSASTNAAAGLIESTMVARVGTPKTRRPCPSPATVRCATT